MKVSRNLATHEAFNFLENRPAVVFFAPLAAGPCFAAEEYAGEQMPIVFAGPQTFIHDDTVVEDCSWTQLEWMTCCYDAVIPEPLARTAKYVRIANVSYAHAREFEIRTLLDAGTQIIVR